MLCAFKSIVVPPYTTRTNQQPWHTDSLWILVQSPLASQHQWNSPVVALPLISPPSVHQRNKPARRASDAVCVNRKCTESDTRGRRDFLDVYSGSVELFWATTRFSSAVSPAVGRCFGCCGVSVMSPLLSFPSAPIFERTFLLALGLNSRLYTTIYVASPSSEGSYITVKVWRVSYRVQKMVSADNSPH